MRGLWLGQAGYLFTSNDGTRIMIDPYLSNSLEEQKGSRFKREVATASEYLHAPIDVLVLTHIHDDHTDFATLDILLAGSPVSVLAPSDVCQALLERYGNSHNYFFAVPGTELSVGQTLLHVTYAAHSTPLAIGIMIEADGVCIYHTGDTLFNTRLISDVPRRPDALFLPINGVGNNMNCRDAYRLYRLLKPRYVFPMHWDMFKFYGCDSAEFTKLFDEEDISAVVIPEHFEFFEIM